MKNLASDCIDVINLLRPINDRIERYKIFSSGSNNYNMTL